MNFFTDTNVPIGYTIIHDEWHEKSCDFIDNTQESIYWSTCVKKEYENTFEEITDN